MLGLKKGSKGNAINIVEQGIEGVLKIVVCSETIKFTANELIRNNS
jgi:hypothetical protein